MVEMLLGKAHSIEFVSSQYYEDFVFLKEEAEEANLGAQLKSKWNFNSVRSYYEIYRSLKSIQLSIQH